jgi:hypothetical protein
VGDLHRLSLFITQVVCQQMALTYSTEDSTGFKVFPTSASADQVLNNPSLTAKLA